MENKHPIGMHEKVRTVSAARPLMQLRKTTSSLGEQVARWNIREANTGPKGHTRSCTVKKDI